MGLLPKVQTAHRPTLETILKPFHRVGMQEFDDINNDGAGFCSLPRGNVETMPDFAAYDPDNLLLGTLTEILFRAGALSHRA